MMYIKIMGSENLPDHDPSKPHTMLTVTNYSTHVDINNDLFIDYKSGGFDCQSRVFSNIYVMNADGKTINTIAPPPGVPST